jgi:hypothetical protein
MNELAADICRVHTQGNGLPIRPNRGRGKNKQEDEHY